MKKRLLHLNTLPLFFKISCESQFFISFQNYPKKQVHNKKPSEKISRMTPSDKDSLPVPALAKEILSLQEERVRQYGRLGDAYKSYLASGPDYDLETYKQCVNDVTMSFKQYSSRIIDMKNVIVAKHNDNVMATFIEKLQDLEEEKLKFTVDHQIAMQQVHDLPDDELVERNAQGLKKKLNSIVVDINDSLEEIKYHIHDIQGDTEENCGSR